MQKNNQNQESSFFSADIIIGEIILALGLGELLSNFDFASFSFPPFFLLIALIVLVVWGAQFLTSWKAFFNNKNKIYPLDGMPHLWITVFFTSLIYLICKYQTNYLIVLVCLTVLIAVDLVDALITTMLSNDKAINKIYRNWRFRDVVIQLPTLIILWVLYFKVDKALGGAISWVSSLVLLLGIILVPYVYDLNVNRDFYNTKNLWAAFKVK